MNSESVVAWREALVRLADQHFFDLVRLYLGAVRTPFNKQKLVEELSAMMRREETKERMVALLDPLDILILAAIRELPLPTQSRVIALFGADLSFAELYERILNLEERLVIFRREGDGERVYAVNPYLEDRLEGLADRGALIPREGTGEPPSVAAAVDSLALAGVFSFFLHNGDPVKNDGSFRKKTRDALDSRFPLCAAQEGCFDSLVAALLNLGLLSRRDGSLVPDQGRWQAFASLPAAERRAYLSGAARGRASRELLRERARGVLEFASSLAPGAAYSPVAIRRLIALISSRERSRPVSRPNSRFAAILRDITAAPDRAGEGSEANAQGAPEESGSDFLAAALAFGIVAETEGGIALNSLPEEDQPLSFVVSPSFSVTVMPGSSLASLLPLVRLLEVEDVQTAGQFLITRRSVSVAFDQGLSAADAIALLEGGNPHGLPGNVRFSVEDWYRAWSSVSLYHGFVLRVDESRRVALENNPAIAALIRKRLAPDIWLLDAESAEEVQDAFSRAGLDPAPSLSVPVSAHAVAPFLPVSAPLAAPAPDPDKKADPLGSEDRRAAAREGHRAAMVAALDALGLEDAAREALLSRIDRRVVLYPEQLDPASVRVEKVEARGMDFLGKVRIAEYAAASGALLEIALDEPQGQRLILGRPLAIEKRQGDVSVRIALEPDRSVETVSVSRALSVRRIRGSIFSELTQDRP